jgi:hypothetical protein
VSEKECSLAPTDHGAKWSNCTGFIDIQRWEEVFGVEDRWCATVGRHFCRRVDGARFRNPAVYRIPSQQRARGLTLAEKLIGQSWRAS